MIFSFSSLILYSFLVCFIVVWTFIFITYHCPSLVGCSIICPFIFFKCYMAKLIIIMSIFNIEFFSYTVWSIWIVVANESIQSTCTTCYIKVTCFILFDFFIINNTFKSTGYRSWTCNIWSSWTITRTTCWSIVNSMCF